jgi:pimeloyl-CoA dehydrogenase small subunit
VDFDLSEEQRLLKESVDRLAADRYAFEQRTAALREPRGWSESTWSSFAELGLLALPFAEDDGGFGGGAVETMIVMETIGRHLMLEPYLATVVLGGGLLRAAATATQRAQLVPRIADGSLLLAFAQAEAQSRYSLCDVSTTARRTTGGWVLNGSKRHVLHGDVAGTLIVSARTAGETRDRHGIGLFLVDAGATGVQRRGYTMQDGLRAADIVLDGVSIEASAVLGDPAQALPAIEHAVDGAIAALCAEAVGAMERTHALTVEYLKTRKQFGVTIGSFQALQHRAVDMLVMVEQARSMAYYATMMAESNDPTARASAMSAVKVQIGQSGRFVGQQAVQLHGGIGVTEECHVGHYFRRLSLIEFLFGDTPHHLARLADAGSLLEGTS